MGKKKLNLFLNTTLLIFQKKETMSYAVSGKEILLKDLSYWNVDLQEAYFSPIEANDRYIKLKG